MVYTFMPGGGGGGGGGQNEEMFLQCDFKTK